MSGLLRLVRRHRASAHDFTLLAVALVVALYLCFEFDLYEQEGVASPAQQIVELDEALTVGALLAVGLFAFAVRRYREQKHETARRVAAEQQIRVLAFQDALTGLANRRSFDDALRVAAGSPPASGSAHALLLLDLNGFKAINDLHGHAAGDEVLIVVARRLQETARHGDVVARFGGDEFAVLARDLIGPEAATTIARRIVNALDEPIAVGTAVHGVSAGVGIALLPRDAETPGEALRKADVALYRAKALKQGAFRYFEPAMDRQIQERDALEQALRAALADGRIEPYFQPSVDLRTRAVVGFKVVPTWRTERWGDVPPERLLPVADDAGMAHALNEHLLRAACAACAGWPDGVTLSIDVPPSVLGDPGLEERVRAALAAAGLEPARLELEIAESTLVRDMEAARDALGALRKAGVRIALGNFGTGYSSLYHLRHFALDAVKIDRSFIDAMRAEPESATIVSALVGLGQGLGLAVVADGVNDPALRASLLDLGCQQAQGPLFSAPVSAEEAAELMSAPLRTT